MVLWLPFKFYPIYFVDIKFYILIYLFSQCEHCPYLFYVMRPLLVFVDDGKFNHVCFKIGGKMSRNHNTAIPITRNFK